jgi:5'-nucleotidase (lipoprotein e(P4) family)
MIRWLVISTTCLLAACTSTQIAPAPPVPAPAVLPPAAEQAVPRLPKEIRWVRGSAEYGAVLAQTYRLAEAAIERRARDRQAGTWAVAIDADETLISNSEQSKLAALGAQGSFEEQWDRWVERRVAPALPGARRFLERVRELGGRIAVVTNRQQHHCPQTADNLTAQKLPFDVILCRGEDSDKHPRWRSVEDGTASPDLPPLEIVMWLGDNIHDFPGLDQELRQAPPEAMREFGDRFIILPNPLYGSWEDLPPE